MRLPLDARTRALTAGGAVLVLASLLPATTPTAGADPVTDAKARAAAAAQAAAAASARVAAEQAHIAAVQRDVDALGVQAEIAAEAYNAAVARLAWADRVARAASARLAAATAVLARLRTRAGAVAEEAYRSGGMAQFALLTDVAGPATLLDREATLRVVARIQRNSLEGLQEAKHEQAFAKVAADGALARQRELAADKRRERDAVLAAAQRQQQLLAELQDAQARLVTQATEAVAQANAARQAVDIAIAARELARVRARAAALSRQRAAAAAAAEAFRLASSAASSTAGNTAGNAAGSTRRSDTAGSSTSGPSPGPPSVAPPRLGSGGAAVAVRWAYRQIGKPYVWAADGPDAFDCSGLTQYVWAKAGVQITHYSGAQFNEGRRVSKSELISGDLVFFGSPIHHVGIYVGNGRMINAPHSGAFVREEPVWWPQYVGAARLSG